MLPAPTLPGRHSSAVSTSCIGSRIKNTVPRRHTLHPPLRAIAMSQIAAMVPRQQPLRCALRSTCSHRHYQLPSIICVRPRDARVRAESKNSPTEAKPVLGSGDRMMSFKITVSKGDTLDGLVAKFGVPKRIILAANSGRSTVKVGDVLEVSVAVSDKVEFSDEEGASEEQLIPAPRRLLHSPTEHLDGLRNAFESRGAQKSGWGQSRAEAVTAERALRGEDGEMAHRLEEMPLRPHPLQNAMDTAGFFGGAAGRTAALALVVAVPIIGVVSALGYLKTYFTALQEERSKDVSTREIAERHLGKAAVSEILRTQEMEEEQRQQLSTSPEIATISTPDSPVEGKASIASQENPFSRNNSGAPTQSPSEDNTASNSRERGGTTADVPGGGESPRGRSEGARGSEQAEFSGKPRVYAPPWLSIPVVWTISELTSGGVLSVPLLSEEPCLIIFQGGNNAQAFCDMMAKEGGPPLVTYPMPSRHALGSAARAGKGIGFVPLDAILFNDNPDIADPDELLVALCQFCKELSIASTAALHQDMRAHQTSAERAADDANIEAARVAVAAQAEEIMTQIHEMEDAEGDEPVLSPSRQSSQEPAPLLESLLSRVKRSVSSSSPQVPPVSSNGNGPGHVRQHKDWWKALPYVCVPLIIYREDDAMAYLTADLARPFERKSMHLLAFEDRGDAAAVKALFELRSAPDTVQIQVHPMGPQQLQAAALTQNYEVTVFRAGQLRVDPQRHEIEDIGQLAMDAIMCAEGV